MEVIVGVVRGAVSVCVGSECVCRKSECKFGKCVKTLDPECMC
jgi:hypothetical protein